MSNQFASFRVEIPRDRWLRPLIVPPEGGKPVPYTRVTTFIGALDDRRTLEAHFKRQVALGLAGRKDLLLAVIAHRENKKELDRICEDAAEAAGGSVASKTGTAIHALTEQLDQGTLDLDTVPDAFRPDIEAYRDKMRELGARVLGIEQFCVHDPLRVAGTFDRSLEIDGHAYMADVKTSNSDLSFTIPKAAMQMAVYSRSCAYDPEKGRGAPIDVDQDRALIIHLPAGKGTCSLHWVDIAAGWDAVQLAAKVRAWRGRKDLASDYEPPTAGQEGPSLELCIRTAPRESDLMDLWVKYRDNGWTPAHTAAAAARKKWLAENQINGQETLA